MNIQGPESIRSELRLLLRDMADNRLSPKQVLRLEELLRAHPEARRSYIEIGTLCAGLEWTGGARSATLDELPAAFIEESPGGAQLDSTVAVSPRPAVFGFLSAAVGFAQQPLIAFLLGAIVLAGLLWEYNLLRLSDDTVRTESIRTPRSSETATRQQQLVQPIAATMTGVVDCNWVDHSVAPTYGEQLHEGQTIQLQSGLVQLTFESGAKLIIQGPAECIVSSDMLMSLNVGKLSAIVPRQASGFTVMTPSAEVIDLGTEFGVQVDPSGEVEVHVFNGEVVSRPLDEHGKRQDEIVRLVDDEAIRFDQSAAMTEELAVDRSRFVREITPRLSDEELPPLPVQRHLALWLAADVRVQTDDQDRVIAWNDLLAGDNQTEEDAWQHDPRRRPIWIENAIGGKPALRFDGKSTGLLTTPIVTTDEQTVTVVFSLGPGSLDRKKGGVLVQYNGPPHRLLNSPAEPGILEINDRKKRGVFHGLVYTAFRDGRRFNVGEVSTPQIETGRAAILTYVYDRANNRARMLVNGMARGTATAPSAVACMSRKAIGYHPRPGHDYHFLGDIAELFIFNAALSSRQLNALHRYLGEKYQIEIGMNQRER